MANIEYAELLQTDAWVNQNRTYPSPGQLSNWFLNELKLNDMFTENCNINAEVSDKIQLAPTNGGQGLTSFQKGLVSIISPFGISNDSILPESNYTVGIIWSYSGKQPIIKVYRGTNVMACMNMMILNADDIKVLKIKAPTKGSDTRRKEVEWNRAVEDLRFALEDTSHEFNNDIENSVKDQHRFQMTLFNEKLDEQQVKNVIADLNIINYELELVNTYTFNFGMAAMLSPNQNGRIFQLYNLHEEGNNRMWNVYNAFTQHLSSHKTEIDTKPEKVLGVTNLIKVVSGMTTVDELNKSRN
jgi:hypothetical protein